MVVVTDLAVGVAGNLVYEALKRPFEALQMALRRQDRIDRVLAGRPSTQHQDIEKRVASATADLARVIGNKHGALTEEVAAFLRELRRTTIPETLAQMALCGRDATPLFDRFQAVYCLFDQLPFGADKFFAALNQAILARVEDVNDPALLEILRAQNHAIAKQLDRIIVTLDKKQDVHPGNRLSLNDIANYRVKISRSIEANNRFINVETLQGQKRIKITSLCIPAKLIPLDSNEISTSSSEREGYAIPYLSFRRQFNRAVILGDPGGGKSTLTQLISFDLSSQISLQGANPTRSDFESHDLKLPLRIELRSFEARKKNQPSYNILDHIIDDIRSALENDDSTCLIFISRILTLGEAFVIFDGLDEILNISSRQKIVGLIEEFSELYPTCPILVTSRMVGYRDAPLCDDFVPYGLARFSKEEIQKYSELAIRAVKVIKLAEAKADAARFVAQTDNIANDLRVNPLMLGLMVQIYVFRGDVPSNRPEIYKECALLMFEKWDLRRKIMANSHSEEFELLDVFSYVASKIFGNAESEAGVSRDWLISELRRNFEGWYIQKAQAMRAAKALVEFITGRAWVMSEVGVGVFKFTHRTFLEYFFARGLISESRDATELFKDKLLPRIVQNEWGVIAHLALHMAIFRDGVKMRQVALAIAEEVEQSSFTSKQGLSLLEFVSVALEYLLIPEAKYRDIVKTIIKKAISIGAYADPTAWVIVKNVLESSNHRTQLAVGAIADEFSRYFAKMDSPEAMFCLYSMVPPRAGRFWEGQSRVVYVMSAREHAEAVDIWPELLQLATRWKDQALKAAIRSAEMARVYCYVFRSERTNLYKKHRQALVFSSQREIVPHVIDHVLLDALTNAVKGLFSGRNAQFNGKSEEADCMSLVENVAEDVVLGEYRGRPNPWVDYPSDRLSSELDSLVGSVWGFGNFGVRGGRGNGASRRFTQHAAEISAILVCVFLLIECLTSPRRRYGAESSQGDTPIRPPHICEAVAPFAIFRRICNALSATSQGSILMAWLDSDIRFLDMAGASKAISNE